MQTQITKAEARRRLNYLQDLQQQEPTPYRRKHIIEYLSIITGTSIIRLEKEIK